MTAIRSMETARTEEMTTKQAFRGCRAIAAAAAVVACGLLAAPLQATDSHPWPDATVTLTATVGDGGQVTLNASVSPAPVGPNQQTDFQYVIKSSGNEFDYTEWWNMGDGSVTYTDFGGYGEGPYSFRARAWNMSKVDGEWRLRISDMSDVVTVDPGSATTD